MFSITSATFSIASRDSLLDHVHDRWFDLEQLHLDRESGLLTVPLADSKYGPFDGSITIRPVIAYKIEDHAHIGVYDINEIAIAPPEIILTSGFPLRVKVSIGDAWEIGCLPPSARKERAGADDVPRPAE